MWRQHQAAVQDPRRRDRRREGKAGRITYGSVGNGSLGHLTMVLLSQRAGVKMMHVPYRGGGPLMNDALGRPRRLRRRQRRAGHAAGQARQVRPIVQTGEARTGLPDVPTVVESGFPGFEAYAWWGLRAGRHAEKNRRAFRQ